MTKKQENQLDSLHNAIAAAIADQRAFDSKRPTRMGRGTEAITSVFGSFVGKFVPAALVLAALNASDRAMTLTIPAVKHDVADLHACKIAALRVQAWAQGLNASSGFAAGVTGAAGLAVDIPATLGMAARTVRATAAVYGFNGDDDAEKGYRLMVLEVATVAASKNRAETLARMSSAAKVLTDPIGKDVAKSSVEWVTNKVVERVARQLGVSLAGRKVGQLVPLMGGVVGAAVNASFQADVARAARFAYEKRWLISRNLLPAPPQADPDAPLKECHEGSPDAA
jgi:hypothetical protein